MTVARYRIDPNRSRVHISARSNVHPIDTETDGLEGFVDLDVKEGGRVELAATPKAHLELPVDQLRSNNRLEDRELKRRIDARRYPTISGDLTDIRKIDGDGSYTVKGDLTFRGVTRSHTDTMNITAPDERTVRLEGESTFDIRDFGMDPPRILMLRVEPLVTVSVSIVAEKES